MSISEFDIIQMLLGGIDNVVSMDRLAKIEDIIYVRLFKNVKSTKLMYSDRNF